MVQIIAGIKGKGKTKRLLDMASKLYQIGREDPHFSGGVSRRKWGMKALWSQVRYNFKH